MINDDLHHLKENPEWLKLLSAYAHAEPLEEGWLTRIGQVEDVADERLPRIHGKLLALGFLDFQFSDRTGGVHYQVTSLGRQGLLRTHSDDEDASEKEPAQEETECEVN